MPAAGHARYLLSPYADDDATLRLMPLRATLSLTLRRRRVIFDTRRAAAAPDDAAASARYERHMLRAYARKMHARAPMPNVVVIMLFDVELRQQELERHTRLPMFVPLLRDMRVLSLLPLYVESRHAQAQRHMPGGEEAGRRQ